MQVTTSRPDIIDLNNSVIILINGILEAPEILEKRWIIYSDTLAPNRDVNYQYYLTSGLKTMKMEASTVYGKATRTSGECNQTR
jgi:hypothetical protein